MRYFLLLVVAVVSGEQNTTLSNGFVLPLLGHGVGNQRHDLINGTISEATRHGVRLFDTASASQKEELVGQALSNAVVVTKVWYTHLGYERTTLSVLASLKRIHKGCPACQVAVLLHWPRCRPDIGWMRCDEEEAELDAPVRALPRGDWRDSWRALEDLYSRGEVAAIGVSNFDLGELRELVLVSRTVPHLVQENLRSLVFNTDLVDFFRQHEIHLQVYNALDGALKEPLDEIQRRRWRAARALLASVSSQPAAQIILGWLVAAGVSVVPRATSAEHIAQNARPVPFHDRRDLPRVATAVEQLLRSGAGLAPGAAARLREAAAAADLDTLGALLREGADPNYTVDENGWSALHEAARSGRLESVEVLLRHGADSAALTNAGDTALELARSSGNDKLVVLLHSLEEAPQTASSQDL